MVDSQKKKSYETYKKVSTLGVGSFGTAYLVECQSDKSYAVIKQIDIQSMSEEERRETLREARVLEVLNHPNIVRFREVYKTKKGKLCIVMDYADGGDLQGDVKRRHKEKEASGKLNYMTEDEVLDRFTQICLAIKHVHDKKILHRDLKSQNIFLTKKGLVKLGDFGISRVLSNTKSKAKTVVGTPYYLSPEIIQSQPYSFKSDIWSLGVLLYEMCALCPPFNAQSLHQLATKIVAGNYPKIPSHFSKNMNDLVSSLLTINPTKRPNVHEILKVPIVEKRIARFLQGETFRDEFSHTLLHNQNVFDEFKKGQKIKADADKKQKEEDERKKAEEAQMAEISKNLSSQLNIGSYQAPKAYMDQYKDQEFFNYQYKKYIEGLSTSPNEEGSAQTAKINPVVRQNSSSTQEEDRGDEEYSELQSQSSQSQPPSTASTGDSSKDEMINITSCEFSEFANYMSRQYGAQEFEEGFGLIRMQKDIIFQEDGEEKMVKLLSHLFPDQDIARGFINFCTTYLIVQNMQLEGQ